MNADGSIVKTNYDPATGLADRVTQLNNNGPSRVSTDQYFNQDGGYSGETITNLSASGNVATTYEEANGGLQTREIDNGLTTSTDTEIGTGPGEATVTTTLPDGTQVQDNYAGDLLQSEKQLDINGNTVTSQSFGYDALGENTSSVDPVFGTTSWTLRLDGSVSGETMPGHATSTVTAADPTTEIPTASTRSDGQTQSQTVNSQGQITSQSGAGLIASTFGYDSATGQLNNLTLYPSGTAGSGTGETTTWGYDPASGLMTSETLADNTTANPDKLIYNYAGAQLHSITGQGDTTTLGYNGAGEQTGSTSNDGVTKVVDTVESQDDQGRPVVVTGTQTEDSNGQVDSSATDSFKYSGPNLTDETQAVGVTVHYDYYPATGGETGSSPGALKDMILYKNGSPLSTTAYQYDSVSGRLQTMWINNNPGTVTPVPDATLFSGEYFGINYKSGTNLVSTISSGGAQSAWNYYTSGGSDGDLSSVTTTNTIDNSSDYSGTYTYNANDQVETATVAQTTPPPSGSTTPGSISYSQGYEYDVQDQLDYVNGTGDSASYTYTYDQLGNRTNQFGTVNSLNEYSAFTYNARGDITNDGTYAYGWDAADQLTLVTADDGSVKVAFQYDGQGRRIEKDVYYSEAGTWTLSYTRKFVYDGTNLVEELDGNGNPITGYTWGPNGLLAVTDFTTTTPTEYLAIVDGQGNVVGLANATTGAVAASYTYDPYGALLSATGPAAGVCMIRYKQSYCDVETHSNHDGVRDDLWIGIWDKPDPAGIAGGSNLYIFCRNDPINNSDSSGLDPVPAGPANQLQPNGHILYFQESNFSGGALGWSLRTGALNNAATQTIPVVVGSDGKAYKIATYQFNNDDAGWQGLADLFDAFAQRGMPFSDASKDYITDKITTKGTIQMVVPGTEEVPQATQYIQGMQNGPAAPGRATGWIPLWGSFKNFLHDRAVGNYGEAGFDLLSVVSDAFAVGSMSKTGARVVSAGVGLLAPDAAAEATELAAKDAALDVAANNLQNVTVGEGAAELRPYGGPGGGHHVPAKIAFEGAPGYDSNAALAVPNAELARLGVDHGLVTGGQIIGYKAFAQTGATLTWEAVEGIETQALVRGGMQPGMARATAQKAIQALKDAGVPGPTRIPWSGR